MNKYKILFAVNSFTPAIGGAEKVCKRMVEILSKEGEVTVLTQYHPDRKDKTGIIEMEAKTSYSYMPKLKEYLNTHDFDLYISFGYGKYFTDYIGYWAKKHKKPSIVMPCGFFHTNQKSPAKVLYSTLMTRYSLNNFSIRVTATEWEKNFWNNRFGVTTSNSFVIPYNLDPDFTKFKETDILKKKKLKKKGYLLYIGRTGPNKLIQLLIDAYNKTNKQLPLVIAGKGTEAFGGYGSVSEDDKKTLIKNAKLCVFPSSFESFGLSVVEPNALKVPVIASNIGPFKELLKDESLLFENDEHDLSKKIQTAFTKTFLIPKISLPDEKANLYKVIDTIIM